MALMVFLSRAWELFTNHAMIRKATSKPTGLGIAGHIGPVLPWHFWALQDCSPNQAHWTRHLYRQDRTHWLMVWAWMQAYLQRIVGQISCSSPLSLEPSWRFATSICFFSACACSSTYLATVGEAGLHSSMMYRLLRIKLHWQNESRQRHCDRRKRRRL